MLVYSMRGLGATAPTFRPAPPVRGYVPISPLAVDPGAQLQPPSFRPAVRARFIPPLPPSPGSGLPAAAPSASPATSGSSAPALAPAVLGEGSYPASDGISGTFAPPAYGQITETGAAAPAGSPLVLGIFTRPQAIAFGAVGLVAVVGLAMAFSGRRSSPGRA